MFICIKITENFKFKAVVQAPKSHLPKNEKKVFFRIIFRQFQAKLTDSSFPPPLVKNCTTFLNPSTRGSHQILPDRADKNVSRSKGRGNL